MTKVGFLYDRDNDWIQRELGGLAWLPAFASSYRFIESFNADAVAGVDVLFILGYTKVLASKFLDLNGLNLVVHESALPLGRGFSPVQWQVLEGSNDIPVRLIEAAGSVDSGDIYGTTTIKLAGHELMPEIRSAQADATKGLIITFLNSYPEFPRVKQTGNATHYRRRSREDDRLNPDKSIRELFNLLRVADNNLYPAYFEIDGVRYLLRITKA